MYQTSSILEKAARYEAEGRAFAFATVVRAVSPTSAKPGAKAIIDDHGVIEGWIGGGCAQPAVVKFARETLKDGQPKLVRVSPKKEGGESVAGIVDFASICTSGGTLDIFIEPVLACPGVLILGASPVAESLCALAARVGFCVTIAAAEADENRFSDANQIFHNFDLRDSFPYIVVATLGKRDEAALAAALGTQAHYIAFVASQRKADKLKHRLTDRGYEARRVDAIASPAGIEIGAVTPSEIALSVLAGIVQRRRCGLSESDIDVSRGSFDHEGHRNPIEETNSQGSCCSE